MKKKLLFPLFLFIFLFSSFLHQASAQTNVTINYAFDSAFTSHCPPPFITDLYVYGTTSGYSLNDSLDVYINFGDGNDSTVRVPLNPNFYFITWITHSYLAAGQYSVEYIATGPDGNADTLINYNQIIVGDTCGNVSGTIYMDGNSNCVYDAGDFPLPWINVELLIGTNVVAWSFSDSLGNYYFSVPTGFPYTVQIGNYYNNYATVCPTSGNYSIPTAPSAGNDFALTCTPGYDLSGYVYGSGFRPNAQPAIVWVHAYNMHCIPVSGQARLVLDPMVTYVSAAPVPASISGDTLTWNFTNLSNSSFNNWWYSFSAYVQVTTSPSAVIGDTVCFTLIEESIAGDADPTNNIQTSCYPVRNSWDPNDKSVVPAGLDPGGRILPSASVPMEYTIHFQNTGNDTAYNVFIMDTIDSNLDMNTFHIVASSHPVDVDIFPGNAVKFSFNNIMLPDSGVNQPGSNGFISYSINQKANLPDGTGISNTAAIYFDFNSPVITNTTVNTIDVTLAVEPLKENEPSVRIYPNPFSAVTTLTISNDAVLQDNNARLKLYDVMGSEITNVPVFIRQGIFNYTIRAAGLSPGIYFLWIHSEKLNRTFKLVKE